jgi:hypothetical protein
MQYLSLIYIFALFYVSIPGTVFNLPFKGSILIHSLVHALFFSSILFFTYNAVSRTDLIEGAENRDVKYEKDKRRDEKDKRRDEKDKRRDEIDNRHDGKDTRHDGKDTRRDERDNRRDERDNRRDERDNRRDEKYKPHGQSGGGTPLHKAYPNVPPTTVPPTTVPPTTVPPTTVPPTTVPPTTVPLSINQTSTIDEAIAFMNAPAQCPPSKKSVYNPNGSASAGTQYVDECFNSYMNTYGEWRNGSNGLAYYWKDANGVSAQAMANNWTSGYNGSNVITDSTGIYTYAQNVKPFD